MAPADRLKVLEVSMADLQSKFSDDHPEVRKVRREIAELRKIAGPAGGAAFQGRSDGATLFPYMAPEQIWNEHRASTRGRDLDITGLSYARLEEPQFWPWPEGATQPRARLPRTCLRRRAIGTNRNQPGMTARPGRVGFGGVRVGDGVILAQVVELVDTLS